MMRFLACALLALAVSAGPAGAFDWPVKNVTLTATFGEDRGDHFHAGIDLGGGEQEVSPIAAGELVFFHEEGASGCSLPVGMGSFLVLQHQGGVRSLYGHLSSGSMEREVKVFDGSKPLGRTGSTGYSMGTHLHLCIIDTEMRTLINPLLVLPPLSDGERPAIKELYVRMGREMLPVKSGMSVRPATAEVVAHLYDLREDVSFLWRLAPYRISLYQDGREASSLVLDGLHERAASSGGPEIALSQSNRSFREVYESEWLYRLGEVKLMSGETTLSVFVADFGGNESSKDFLLRVTE